MGGCIDKSVLLGEHGIVIDMDKAILIEIELASADVAMVDLVDFEESEYKGHSVQ